MVVVVTESVLTRAVCRREGMVKQYLSALLTVVSSFKFQNASLFPFQSTKINALI